MQKLTIDEVAARYDDHAMLNDNPLPWTIFRKVMSAKVCTYTGREFNEDTPLLRRAIVKKDPSKPWCQGNVVCVLDIWAFAYAEGESIDEAYARYSVELGLAVKTTEDVLAEIDTQSIVNADEQLRLRTRLAELECDEAEINENQLSHANHLSLMTGFQGELKAARDMAKKLNSKPWYKRMFGGK